MLTSFINLLKKKPTLCIYDITARCNSKCSMCNMWKRKEDEMSVNEIRKIFTDLKKFGIHTVFVQGGEPLIRKELFEVVSMLDGMGFTQNIISNGILMSDDALGKLDKMNKNGRIMVTISLDTFDKKKYIEIRGVDQIERVLENIKHLAKYKGLNGNIHTTVTSINFKELDDINKFATGLELDHSFNTYNDNINYISASNENLNLKNTEQELVIKEMKKVRSGVSRISRPFIDENIKYMRDENVGSCDAFTNSLRVSSEGKLSPCIEFPPILDLRTNDINKEWKKVSKSMKDKIKTCYTNSPCFYGCTRGIGSVKKNLAVSIYGLWKELRK
ncbi:MAG: radical SAM protein [Nanoarchaeota archaeon]